MKRVFFLILLTFFLWQSAVSADSLLIDNRLSLNVEIVRSIADQRRGLGGRKSLKEGTGMLFLYNNPAQRIFWMKGMLISIDMIWIHKGIIQQIIPNIPPPSPMIRDNQLPLFGHGILADMVLEVPSGYSRKADIQVGQTALLQ